MRGSRIPRKNVHWKDLRKSYGYRLSLLHTKAGFLYVASYFGRGHRPAVVCWNGEEANKAQAWLAQRLDKKIVLTKRQKLKELRRQRGLAFHKGNL